MIILACETSTLLGSVAVLKDQRVLSYVESPRQGSHSDILNLFIEKALLEAGLQLKDVDLFVTGAGPGSFTGLRISLNAVKTLAYCYDKPVLGLDSLQNLARGCFEKNKSTLSQHPIVAMINAFKNMVYAATYRFENEKLVCTKPPEVVRVQNLKNYLSEKSYVIGDGFAAYEKYFEQHLKDLILRPEKSFDEPNASLLGVLATENLAQQQNWSQLVPIYLRASEAEENAQGIKYEPLI